MANPSRLKKVQITENSASATAPKVVVQEANGELNNQNINSAFNKNYGLGNDETISADLFKNQYSNDPVIWSATSFSIGNIVFYGGKQWIAESATVAGDVPSVSTKWKEITFESLEQNKVNKSGIEVSLPILNADNEKVGEISHYEGYPVIKGESGVVLQGASAIVSSLNGFDDYLVGVGLNGQLIPVRKESTSIYAPTANSTTVQNLTANVSTELLAKITLTLPLVNPTLQWSINVTNTGVQLAVVSAKLGLDGVATGSPALYSVPKNTTMILSGASPYAANLPIGTILSTFLTSDRALRVNSITIKASSGIQSSTIDQTIIDGSTNAVSGNAVFDALALKIGGTGLIGQLAFWNGTNSQIGDNALFWNNTSKYLGISTNSPLCPLDVRGYTSNHGFAIYSANRAFNFDNDINSTTGEWSFRVSTTTVAKLSQLGDFTAKSFIKSSAPTTNILLAGGGDVAQSTFFPAPTGLTTNYLPKWNGTGFGNSLVFDNGTNVGIGSASADKLLTLRSNQSTLKLVVDTEPNDYWTEIQNIYQSNSFKLINRTAGITRELLGRYGNNLAILPNSDGNTLFGTTTDNGVDKVQVNGTISASPATASNHVVVKSQLDAVGGTSGTYTPTYANGMNTTFVSFGVHRYSRIGNLVFVQGMAQISLTTSNITSTFTITLPIARASTVSTNLGFGNISGAGTITEPVTVLSASTTTAVIGVTAAMTGQRTFNYCFSYLTTE